MLDRPSSGFREVPVEVQRAFRDPRFRIDPEIEAQAFVDIAHADDLVHPGVRKAALLLIMSTRWSAKVSNNPHASKEFAAACRRETARPRERVACPRSGRRAEAREIPAFDPWRRTPRGDDPPPETALTHGRWSPRRPKGRRGRVDRGS